MKIKKPATQPAGSATIADRFKLDTPDSAATKKSAQAGKDTLIAFICALAALAISGVLTYILYQHWEFLMPA